MSVLNVPIQINRGTFSLSVGNELAIGEPFFNLDSNTLYIKSSDSNLCTVNITGNSTSTSSMRNRVSNNLYDFTEQFSYCTLGGYHITRTALTANSEVFTYSPTTNASIIINSPQVRTLGITTLSNSMYGRSLPSSGSNGQLFFLIS